MYKFKLHSVVDVITNSSTVIYTYHNGCVDPAKELINEMLKLSGIDDKKAEDIFYFGVFCDHDRYFDCLDNPDDYGIELPDGYVKISGNYGSEERKESITKRHEWLDGIILSIIKGDMERPEWMNISETNDYGLDPDRTLVLIPKDEKYKVFGEKILSLLGSVDADGERDG